MQHFILHPSSFIPTFFSLLADFRSAGSIIHKEETLRTYEVSFIVNPNTTDDELKKLTGQLEQIIADQGGKITKADHQGRRKTGLPHRQIRRRQLHFPLPRRQRARNR
jgi:hypothetical protein